MSLRVLGELGIRAPYLASKHVDVFSGQSFDRVISLCDEANEVCPVFFGSTRREHISFPDPGKVPEEAQLEEFRRVRDMLREKLLPILDKK